MQCPACDRMLQQMMVGDITLDVCRNGCGGIWFDNFELDKYDEHHESAGEELLDLPTDPAIVLDEKKTRLCPKCENQKMVRHFRSVKGQIVVDECYACGGIWLDQGELKQIRDQFPDDESRHQAAREYFSTHLGTEMAKMHAESEEGSNRAQKIAKSFRFLCPSYYLPGKQEWGAY